MESYIKGYEYEIFVCGYIRSQLAKPCYLWKETPDEVLIAAGIIHSNNEHRLHRKNSTNSLMDTGVDLVQDNLDNTFTIVQCKNGYDRGIRMHDLQGIYMWMFNHPQLFGAVYYTSKLHYHITENINPKQTRLEYIKMPFDNSSIASQLDKINSNLKTNSNSICDQLETIQNTIKLETTNLTNLLPIKPHDYQIEARDAILEYFADGNSKAILSLPCGTGKTYTSWLVSNEFKQVILISPLKQFAKQNLDRFVEYGFSSNVLLVDSDGTRDLIQIKQFIKQDSWLLSCTYKSVDLIEKIVCVNNQFDGLIIIDEFHNLSKANICSKSDPFFKVLATNNKFLLMSATPRIYDMEYGDGNELEKDKLEEVDSEAGSEVDLEEVDSENNSTSSVQYIELDDPVYSMSFNTAIEKGFITDYRIYLPSVHETNEDLDEEIGRELCCDLNLIDNELKAKCIFLFKCLVEKGARKCIVYCEDTKKLEQIIKIVKQLNEYYYLDLNISTIISSTSKKVRSDILNNFASENSINLLFSIRILDECIDIKSCDSVFITYETSCKIRTIQRICRAVRTDPTNKFKIAKIFMWCTDYAKILETLSGIKEHDTLFKDKISVLGINHHGKNEKQDVINSDISKLSNYVVGIKEFKMKSWYEKLQDVKDYIDVNLKAPTESNKDKNIRQLSIWITNQKQSYNKCILKDKKIYNTWTNFINDPKYSQYINKNLKQIWINKLENVKIYIDENSKTPSKHDKDKKTKQLAYWISDQKKKYDKNMTKCKYIMKDKNIYNLWTEFINNDIYSQYVNVDTQELWFEKLEEIINYINLNNKLPTYNNKNISIKQLGTWLHTQKINYDLNINKCKKSMKKKDINMAWTEFINNSKYREYFYTNKELWFNKFNKLKEYINLNNKLPSRSNINNDIKYLADWVRVQKSNYNLDISKRKNSMKDKEIFKIWSEFINSSQYKKYSRKINNEI